VVKRNIKKYLLTIRYVIVQIGLSGLRVTAYFCEHGYDSQDFFRKKGDL